MIEIGPNLIPGYAMETSAPDREEIVAELTENFLEMLRHGDSVTPESYAAEHPEYASELMELLPSLVQMEDLGKSSSSTTARSVFDYPKNLGDYQLGEKLGSGGMGTVFRATQQSLQREVAVKILSPSWSSDTRHSEAFENESKLIAGLRHTNIVEVFGAGKEGPWRYYVMSLVHGRGLRAENLHRAFPHISHEQAVARVGLQAAEALAYAHEHGVLHRDVKPGNLLLDDEGVVHVSDFGLATVLNAGEEAPLVTQTHDGTLRYMPPERLLHGENSFAGDQYSLGLTLYELITRKPVFRETEPGKLVRHICSDPLPPLKNVGELGAIINKSISFHPKDRYATMADMAEDLRRFLRGEPVVARPASCLRRYIMWMRRKPAVAAWSHAAAALLILLFVTMITGYVRVRASWRSENEQRLLAERNAQIADASLQRIFSGMVGKGGADEGFLPPSRADARLIQDLMPYYEQIVAGAKKGSEKMAEACFILASIALQTGDYDTAEIYYRRSINQLAPHSAHRITACNGLASALYSQERQDGTHPHRQEANKMLLSTVKEEKDKTNAQGRLELVHSLMLVARHSAACPCGEQLRCPHPQPGRGVLLTRASLLLGRVLKELPNDKKAQLRRVELLSLARTTRLKRILAPNGEQALTLLDEMLEAEPNSEELRRVYLRMSAQQAPVNQQPGDMMRALEYAQDLLAAAPGDSEAILLYFAMRDRYTRALQNAGRSEEASKEGERTIGVLSFLTSRADFSQKTRERLIMLVTMHPAREEESARREEELRTLLRDYDGRRIQILKRRMQRMRMEMEKGHAPPSPARIPRKKQPQHAVIGA